MLPNNAVFCATMLFAADASQYAAEQQLRPTYAHIGFFCVALRMVSAISDGPTATPPGLSISNKMALTSGLSIAACKSRANNSNAVPPIRNVNTSARGVIIP